MYVEDLISIIIPVYNAEKYILECVESIEKQTYQNFEIILVDDGSTDQSGKICDQIIQENDKVHCFHINNGGASCARNFGLLQANGKYITFVDADDTVENQYLECMINDMKNKDVDIVVSGLKFCNFEGEVDFVQRYEEKLYENRYILKEFLKKGTFHWGPYAKLYKREVLENVKFPENYRIAEDMFFLYTACKNAKTMWANEKAFYNYMKRENSAMEEYENLDKFFDNYKLVEKVYIDVKDNLPELEKEAWTFYAHNLIWFLRFLGIRDKKGKYIYIWRKKILGKINRYSGLKCSDYIRILLFKYCFEIYRVYLCKKTI